MARRWLLTVLTGAALSVGFAGSASALELAEDPIVVDAEVATATVTADSAERTVAAELATDVTVEEAETEIAPTATVAASEDGATLDVAGTTEVAGEELPIPQVTQPVEDAVGEPAPAPTPDQAAAGSGVSAAPQPASAPAPTPADDRGTVSHSNTLSADRAARSGFQSGAATYEYEWESELSPEVAPPADTLPVVAAAAPTVATELSLPVLDTTPTVPALLRLLAGLMVLGAAATWRTVRDELA